MNYYKILWVILGSLILNTWRDIITFYWYRCSYIGPQGSKDNKDTLKKS